MAIIYRAATGTVEKGITGAGEGGIFTLEQLQKAVDGYIEAVPGTGGRAFCNEDGRMRKLPPNIAASLIFSQMLVGDVIVLEEGDKDGPDEDEQDSVESREA